MNIFPALVCVFLAGGTGFCTTAYLNKGCSSFKIEDKSFFIGTIVGFILVFLFFIIDVLYLKPYTDNPMPYLLVGAIGGLVGHFWHENWESKYGKGTRVCDLGLPSDVSLHELKEAKQAFKNKTEQSKD